MPIDSPMQKIVHSYIHQSIKSSIHPLNTGCAIVLFEDERWESEGKGSTR